MREPSTAASSSISPRGSSAPIPWRLRHDQRRRFDGHPGDVDEQRHDFRRPDFQYPIRRPGKRHGLQLRRGQRRNLDGHPRDVDERRDDSRKHLFRDQSSIQSDDIFDNSNGVVIGSINGGSGNNTFIIGTGSNVYNPSGVADKLDFGAAFGNDVINGFKTGVGHDVITFSGGDFSSFAELQSHMAQVGVNTVITLEAGSTIDLTHTTIAHLSAVDFVFG